MAASRNTWPTRDDFAATKSTLDTAVLELDKIRDRLADGITPPVTAEQVADLSGFIALADLDLRIARGTLDQMIEYRCTWQSWLVTRRDGNA